LSAPEVLFERKGMHWNSSEERTKEETIAAGTQKGVGEAIRND
jgi:hypothetical protein